MYLQRFCKMSREKKNKKNALEHYVALCLLQVNLVSLTTDSLIKSRKIMSTNRTG